MLNPDNATLEWCAKWIEDSLRSETNERTIEFGKNMAMTIRAVKTKDTPSPPSAAPVVDKGGVRKLTPPELNHLSALLEAERESGSYAGPREQYYARRERLIEWCRRQIGDSK